MIFVLIAVHGQSYAQHINWMTFDEAVKAQEKEKRKWFVDIYTSWCTWCKKMDQTTFQNPIIADFVNANYYPIKFDAEQTKSITFKDREYNFIRDGSRGYHELAVELTLGRLSYPSIVFLDEELQVIQALRGFQSALRFEQIMTYFARDLHKSIPWSRFSENYHPVLSRH